MGEWDTVFPMSSGWYWIQEYHDSVPTVVEVTDETMVDDGVVYVKLSDGRVYNSERNRGILWSGPLEAPTR